MAPNTMKGERRNKRRTRLTPDLVDVTGHPGDQGRSSDGVHLCEREGLNMCKELMAELGGEAYRSLCRKILGGDGTGKSDESKSDQNAAHLDDIAFAPASDTGVDDSSND